MFTWKWPACDSVVSDFTFQDAAFQTALEYADKRKQVFKISTGSTELEWVLGYITLHVH